MNSDHPHERRRRQRIANAVVALLLGGMGLVFFRVQVLGSDRWKLQSESNRLRPLPLPAPRGTVFDRNGRIVSENVPGYEVTLLPAPLDTLQATLGRLQGHLQLSDERIDVLLRTARRFRGQPLLVTGDADFSAVAAVEERRTQFPGVFIEMRPKRRYPAGDAAAHVLGYVGEINQSELDSEEFQGYEPRMTVGKEGLEKQYERVLQGTQGLRYVEVDAAGRIVGSFRGESAQPAVPGADLVLNLDLDLMEWIHELFPDSMRGAVVVLDPADGSVLALYSNPSYDPNSFVGGIATEEWDRLNTDPNRPLYNRAVMGLYPPASTFKTAVAAIGLELGVVSPTETMPQPCTGVFHYGNASPHCWNRAGHGYLDLAGALAASCDIYFYQLGLRIGLQRLLDEAGRLGFRSKCGIDLPQESRGIFPADSTFWMQRWGYKPTEGEVLSLAIGQGANSQTPLKVAQFYVAIARDDHTAPAPRLLKGGELGEAWKLDLSNESVDALRTGLRRVMQEGGTGYLSSLEHWTLWGKSGTGQNETGLDHAFFALMAAPRGGKPELVVVALVEQGESGSGVAAPIAAKAADFYLRRKYGIPVDSIQTLRDHWRVGRPAPWAVLDRVPRGG